MVKNLPADTGDIRDVGLIWEDLLEKGMATHSSILAWRIPWTEPVFWLGEFPGQRSLEGYSLWCCKELDMTE